MSCKYCKKRGHVIDDCYKLHNENKAATNPKRKQPTNSGQVSVEEDDTMMVNSSLFMIAIRSLMRNGFLILIACFICVLIKTGFQHMKLQPELMPYEHQKALLETAQLLVIYNQREL